MNRDRRRSKNGKTKSITLVHMICAKYFQRIYVSSVWEKDKSFININFLLLNKRNIPGFNTSILESLKAEMWSFCSLCLHASCESHQICWLYGVIWKCLIHFCVSGGFSLGLKVAYLVQIRWELRQNTVNVLNPQYSPKCPDLPVSYSALLLFTPASLRQ